MASVKIMVLGGEGMLAHRVMLSLRERHDVRVTLRNPVQAYAHHGLFNDRNAYGAIDAMNTEAVSGVLQHFQPDAVLNGVGIVKQRAAARDFISSIEINALLPHRLAQLCRIANARLVHMSTDCVFDGTRGAYRETDFPDARDLYGRSKSLGELDEENCITIRSSIVGLELANRQGLIEWYLSQKGPVRGYARALFSGLNTHRMALAIEHILVNAGNLRGVWHVASAAISKYDLLVGLTERLGRTDITIVKDEQFVCDRSLIGDRFNRAVAWKPPAWDVMLDDLAQEIQQRGRTYGA